MGHIKDEPARKKALQVHHGMIGESFDRDKLVILQSSDRYLCNLPGRCGA